MRRLFVLMLALAFVAVPAAALAQEPYSSSTTTTGNLPPTAGGDDPDVPYTGFGITPLAVAITALVLFGSGTLWFARRARDKADD